MSLRFRPNIIYQKFLNSQIISLLAQKTLICYHNSMNQNPIEKHQNEYKKNSSFLVKGFERIIDFRHDYLMLSNYLFRKNESVFPKIEGMLLTMLFLCIIILSSIQYMPYYLGFVICVILLQRILEYLIVYSRNFILNKGRIFTHFTSEVKRGQWLILVFFLNTVQVLLIFAIWYKFISIHFPASFSVALNGLDSFYFSFTTFLTVGYGDILPLSNVARILVVFQSAIFFYTMVIVINGLMAIHIKENAD